MNPLAALVGHTIPGGCGDCTADQVVKQPDAGVPVYVLEVQHDATCPWWLARQKGRS